MRRVLAEGEWTRHRASDDRILLFERSDSLPRAFVTYNVSSAPPTRELLSRMSDPKFDPLVQSFVESAEDLELPSSPLKGAPATIVRDQAHVVEVEANLEVDGFLILADSFYPGWKATVDGRPVDILPANHLFRGTPVPAGSHRIRFEYAPESYRLGKLLTLGGAVFFLLGIVPIRWRLLRSRI